MNANYHVAVINGASFPMMSVLTRRPLPLEEAAECAAKELYPKERDLLMRNKVQSSLIHCREYPPGMRHMARPDERKGHEVIIFQSDPVEKALKVA